MTPYGVEHASSPTQWLANFKSPTVSSGAGAPIRQTSKAQPPITAIVVAVQTAKSETDGPPSDNDNTTDNDNDNTDTNTNTNDNTNTNTNTNTNDNDNTTDNDTTKTANRHSGLKVGL